VNISTVVQMRVASVWYAGCDTEALFVSVYRPQHDALWRVQSLIQTQAEHVANTIEFPQHWDVARLVNHTEKSVHAYVRTVYGAGMTSAIERLDINGSGLDAVEALSKRPWCVFDRLSTGPVS
jgi:hypothetical protein